MGNDIVTRSSRGRRAFLKATGAVGIAGVAGCVGGGESGGEGDDSGDEGDDSGDGGPDAGGSSDETPDDSDDELTELQLAIPHFGTWDLTYQFLVGQEQGFFADEGLSLSRVDVSGGGENVRTVVSGEAQIGFGTGIFALFASYREGSDTRIVSNEIASAGDIIMFSAPDSGYETLEDCVDAQIGYSRPGSSTNMVVERAIEYADLTDAEAVSVGGPPDALAAVETGEIDVGWAIPFFSAPRIRSGEIHEVFTGDQIPPFDDMTIRVNFSTQEWLDDNPETARSFFRAWQRSGEYAYDNLDEATRLWAEMLDQDREPLREAVENYYPREVLELDRMRNVEEAMEIAVEYEFIDEVLSDDELDELMALDYLP